MTSLISSGTLIFLGGMFSGTFITLILSAFFKSRKVIVEKTDEPGIQLDYTSSNNYGSNKLILVVRTDLNMGKGKVAAQCSHAAVIAHELSRRKTPTIHNEWKRNGQPKIVVKIEDESEMLALAEKAQKRQLLVSMVQDAGRTQVAAGSRTVLAIGPGPTSVINEVTGHLKLY